jgi:hypothetical protein
MRAGRERTDTGTNIRAPIAATLTSGFREQEPYRSSVPFPRLLIDGESDSRR